MDIYLNEKPFIVEMNTLSPDHPQKGTRYEWETKMDPFGIGKNKFIYTWNSLGILTSSEKTTKNPRTNPELHPYIESGEFAKIKKASNEFRSKNIPNPDHIIKINTRQTLSREFFKDITSILEQNDIPCLLTPDYGPALDYFYYASPEIAKHLNS